MVSEFLASKFFDFYLQLSSQFGLINTDNCIEWILFSKLHPGFLNFFFYFLSLQSHTNKRITETFCWIWLLVFMKIAYWVPKIGMFWKWLFSIWHHLHFHVNWQYAVDLKTEIFCTLQFQSIAKKLFHNSNGRLPSTYI